MKGKCKRLLCAMLVGVMLLTAPTTVRAQKMDLEKIQTCIENNSQWLGPSRRVNTKAKTVTLYAGLLYRFYVKDYKETKTTWKISRTNIATLEDSRWVKGTAVVRTKKAGKFTITAMQGKKKYTYKVTVKDNLQMRYLKTKILKENKAPKQLSWEPMPGAEGYIVYRTYQSEDGSPEFGWRDGQVEVLKIIKGNKKTSYNIRESGNWDIFWRMGWYWSARGYKIINGKVYISSGPEDAMSQNLVKLK